MNMSRGRPDMLGDISQERDHVVIGGAFDLVDALDIEFCPALDGRKVLSRNLPRLARQNFNLQPDGELVLLRPNSPHPLTAVPANHNPPRLAERPVKVNAPPYGVR